MDPNIVSWFRAVDQDNSGQINALELSQALQNGSWSKFSEESCRMMISKLNVFFLLYSKIMRFVKWLKNLFDLLILFFLHFLCIALYSEDCALTDDDILLTDLFDHDHTGTINLQEFGQLFTFINQWIEVYRRFDKDNSGTISEPELMSGTEGWDFKFRLLCSNEYKKLSIRVKPSFVVCIFYLWSVYL